MAFTNKLRRDITRCRGDVPIIAYTTICLLLIMVATEMQPPTGRPREAAHLDVYSSSSAIGY